MAQQNNIAQQLNDLLVTRNFHPDMLDAQGKVCDSEDAKTFTFDYISGAGKNYGTMVVILDSDNDLKAFYGDNLGRSMEGDDKNEFFDFQQHLSQFANAHRWTYTAKDLGQLKHTMQGLAAIKEGLFEGYYGTRRISYAGEPTEARLMIRHNRNLGETDARFRYVESIFVETADGERYRLPFTNLAGGRAMLEHVRQGGKPYDVRGNHICEMITELKVLTRFNRASQGRVVEGVKQSVVQGAQTYYKSLRENIKRLSSPRGYAAYFESWHPADITEQDQLVEDIKTLFVEQTIDDRIEQALPLLAKIQRGREMKEADIFENWVNTLAEGTWSLPETPEQLTKLKELMSKDLIVGPDGTNATEQLYDLIGDDVLFDRISELAQEDPRANLWDDTEVQARMQQLGIQMPANAAPDMDAQPQQAMAEGTGTGEYSRVLTALGLYYPRLSMEELNTPGYHKVIANKAGVPVEYAADIINDFANPKDYWSDDENDEQGVAEEFVDQSPDETMDDPDQDDRIANFQKIGQPMDARVGGQRTTTGPDFRERTASVTGPDSRGMHKVTVTQDDDIASQYLTKNPPSNSRFFVGKDTNEADNVSTFESLQRMRHLSGMPLKENALNDSGSTLGHIIQTYQRDVRDFIQSGSMSDHLYDALYDYYFDDMPYGVKKARTGDPYEWIGQRFYDDLQGSDMVDENLGGVVGEAGAGAGQGNRGKLPGARAYPVPSPNLVQTGEIPSPKITAMALPDPLPMASINSAPMKGLDLTQGRPGRLDDYELPMSSINSAPVKGLDLTQGRPGRLDDYEQQLEEGCNYTMENDYCPVHGLKECWLEEMNLSILATGSQLIEDLDKDYGPSGPPGGKVSAMGTNIFKRGPKSTGAFDTEAGYFAQPEYRDATRSQADNDRAKRIRDWEKMTGQDDVSPEYNNQFRPIPPRTPTPRTSAAMAKPVPSAKITATDLPDEVDDQGRQYFQNYMIDTDGKQIPRIRVDGVGRTQDEPIDEADMMNPEIPKDFGSPEHLAHLAGLGKALQSGDRSALGKSNAALAAAQIGQGKTPWEPAPTPSFSTPGAAHAGQGGYDYQDEEPKGRAHSGQGGYNYYDYDDQDQSSAETARLGRLRNPNVDPALAHMLINPNNPDAFAMQRDDEPDQSDAETARLGRAGASADSEFVQAPGEAGRSLNYESREGDAMLARIKSLALLR